MPEQMQRIPIWLVWLPLLISAQDLSSVAITGKVLDPHPAAVLGAQVTLARREGAVVQSTTADSSGTFRFQGVPPGEYDVRIERQGFKPSVSRVRVGNQSPRALNVLLSL